MKHIGKFTLHSGVCLSDCTTVYKIQLNCDITVGEFIEEVLKNKREFGTIAIYNEDSKFENSYRYNEGKLLSKLPKKYNSMRVVFARSVGGWGLMVYELIVKGA